MNNSSTRQDSIAELCTQIGSAVQLAISLSGIIANLLLITAHIKDPLKTFKTSSSPFILNIAVIDFIMSIVFLIHSLRTMTIHGFRGSRTVEKIFFVVFILISFPSFFSLSLERFCSVAVPVWHRVRITNRVCCYWLGTMWLVHLVLVGLKFAFSHDVLIDHIFEISYTGFFFLCSQILYLGTYVSLKNQRRVFVTGREMSNTASRATKIRLEHEKQFLFTITIVCSILALTLLPSLANLLLGGVVFPDAQQDFEKQSFAYPIYWTLIVLLTINFAVNPFVYVWRLQKYRNTFKKMYCKFVKNV